MDRVLVINGPNLNLLGVREPDVYGTVTLPELEERIKRWGVELGVSVDTFQSNHEGAIIDKLHAARDEHSGVVINGGAFTHYSYAIHDAILATELPTVEIHISNIHAREPWRRTSVTGPACDYVIFGRGIRGYRDALTRLVNSASLPPSRYRYGDGPSEFGELRLPAGEGPHQVAVLIHGGFWWDEWTLDLMDNLAINLVERGWAAWNIEYRRLGTGGGFPVTMEDVAAGIDFLRTLADEHPLDLSSMAVVGHSSGGQLALWAAKRSALYDADPQALDPLLPASVVALAPVSDLAEAHRLNLGPGAVEGFLRRDPAGGADRYAAASPRSLVPLGVPHLVVHGAEDQVVPPQMSTDYVATAKEAGDPATLLVLSGDDHFDVIDPASQSWTRAAGELTG